MGDNMFLRADTDGDGFLGREDLEAALGDVEQGWWDQTVNIDVDDLIEAADFSHSDTLTYSEFMAIMLHAKYKENQEDLIRRTFKVLDDERPGWVFVQRIRHLF